MTPAELGQSVTASTSLLLLGLAGYGAANLRFKVPGTALFVALCVAGAFWTFGYTIEKGQTTVEGFFWAARLEYVGLAFIPPLWLCVALSWMNHPLIKSMSFRVGLLAVCLTLLTIVFTNDLHHWFYRSIALTGRVGFARFQPGIIYYPYVIIYLSTFVASTVLVFVHRRHIPLFRRKAGVILAANSFPFLFALAYQVGIRPAGLDLTLFSLVPAFAVLAWGLFRHDFVRVLPVAREVVIEGLEQAVVVINDEGKLVDHNPAARPYLDAFRRALLDESRRELVLETEQGSRAFRIRRSALPGTSATAALFTDITEEKRLLDELAHQAAHDALTGLPNRRAFEDSALGEVTRASRQGGTLSLVLFDLDWFKDINDRFGHPQGDRVLRTVAELLVPRLRPYDLLARVGGEEFAVLMPGAQVVEAREAAERWRACLEASPHQLTGAVVPVTASFGVATLADLPLEMTDPRLRLDALLVLADKALYRAKAQGRNRVV